MILLTLLLLAILGNLARCFVHYQKVKVNAFSKEEVKKAANEQVQRIKYKDPVISCDYCGSKVDTSKYKTCPHCGGAYDRDAEWLNRFNVKDSFIENSTQNIINAREKKGIEEQKKAGRNLTIAELMIMLMYTHFSFRIVNTTTNTVFT